MKNEKIMAMPPKYFFGVAAVCILGILIGSFFDLSISEHLANKTELGAFFATYGSILSYALYPAAGMCIFKGLLKKGEKFRMLAWTIFILSFFLAVYYSNEYNGAKVRELFGYEPGVSAPAVSLLTILFWLPIYLLVPLLFSKTIDEADSNKLIATGCIILIAGLGSDLFINLLKQFGSRPRYKYLLTLPEPAAEFRNWWQFRPNLAGSNDNFKSWPSLNMTIAAMMFSLPLLADVTKKRSKKRNIGCFVFACLYVAAYGYNRIHMTNHFLSDVCFGVLITLVIFMAVSKAFIRAAEN